MNVNIDTILGGHNAAPHALKFNANTDGINDLLIIIDDWLRNSEELDARLMAVKDVPSEGSVEEIVRANRPDHFPRSTAEAVVDADTGELEKLLPIDISDAQEPRVNLRNVHARLESKQEFAHWVKNRVEQCDLVEDQDYGVFDKFIKNPSGGRPSKEYWVTLDAAKEIALAEGTAKGKEIRRYFIECEKRLRNMPTAPAFQIPQTYAEALRLSADTTEANERLTRQIGLSQQIIGVAAGRLAQAQEDLGAASHELAKAQVDLEEEERVNADLVALRALEAASLPLGEWASRTFNDTGHNEITARKVMSCRGLLNRELVRGRKNYKEATIPSALLDARKLIYSHVCVDKLKRIKRDGPIVTVVDSEGKPVKIEPRVILVCSDYMPTLASWFMTSDETMLRRLVHTRKGEVIHRLKGRYSFYDYDTRAQENLDEEQLSNMVTLVKPTAEDSTYKAYCNVRDNRKDGDSRVVYGEGKSLERALYDLAEHYLDGRN